MASKPNKTRATSLNKSDQRSQKSPNNPKPNKPKGSMGLGLLMIAIGTSLIGLGGLGYLVYQELLSSARREVDRSAEAQTRQIETKFTDIRQSVDGVAGGARVLLQQQPKPKTAEPYKKLVVEAVKNADPVAGMGIASNGALLFPPAKPLVPYVWKEESGLKTELSGQKLAIPNDKLLSGDRTDIQKAPFYQETLKGKASWSQPYTALGKTIITYSAPISDGQKVVGIVSADAIATELLSITAANPSAASESKIGFVVINASGKVITASDATQNPVITEALPSLAQQAQAQGIAQTGGNLWAYRKIAGSDWLVAAYLPESEITNKLLVLVGGAAVGISAILAIAILGFVNSLKKRLQPLTEECDRFLSQQGNAEANVQGKDEIDRLGLSLKHTFQQVKTNEIRLRGELAQSSDHDTDDISSAKAQQNLAETELMEAEVGDLLDVVSSMEEGDLTVEAQVNDRATGLVADTLNRLREKLVEIISSVLGTAQQVAQGASDLEELARTVVLNTAEQAQSVTQGQALTEQVATIASRSAAQVNVANQSLQEVRDTVASGQTAINTLTDSISVLQSGSAQIVQRMKTLGEFVGLAEQFVQDQGQIASLTQVLALNATLVAARAAEQKDPKQFASVAREFESIAGQVNDLATQTNDGLTVLQQRTSQIQTVVTAIDVEVQNLSGLVSGFTSGVESSQAAFNSIQGATEEVVQIGQTITESSTEIANAAGSTASYISEIAQLADRTADLTRSARQQAEAMGNQAQQLLQGIQFFRLPESSGLVNPANNATSNLGLVVPAIAVAATAVTLSQSGQAMPSAYAASDDEDNTTTDSRYLENMLDESLDESIDSDLSEINATDSPQVQNFAAVSEDFRSEDVPDIQNQASPTYSDLTDISLIEESLLADLKHELYDEDTFDDPAEEDLDIFDDANELEPSLKNPMEGVNEFAIVEASSDPIIVSATSSFLDDTAFGTVSPLAEDSNLNLSAFVDFTIPDLDDDDFIIPKMDIESTLDDSNSFFDGALAQGSEVSESSVDFDPFAMDEPIQSSVESGDYAIADNDSIFEPSFESLDGDLSIFEDIPADVPEGFTANVFDDYSQFTSDDAINESVEESVESLSNTAFSDAFDTSFDESSFNNVLDESLSETTNDEFNYELDQPVDIYTNDLESERQDDVADLPTQIPDIYLDATLDDEFPEEFTFEIDESTSEDLATQFEFDQNLADDLITEQVNELDSSWQNEEDISGGLDFSDPFDFVSIPVGEDLLESSEITIVPEPAIAIETNIQELPVLDLSEQQLEDFPEEISEDFSVVLNLAEAKSETGFLTLIDENEDLEDDYSGQIWQAEEIASDLVVSSDIGEESSEILTSDATNFSSSFDLPDFLQLQETDEGLMDEAFNFGIPDDNDFGALTNSLDAESLDFTEGILSDSESDISSIFSNSESLNDSIVNTLDIDENVSPFEALTEGIDSAYESMGFSEILDSSNPQDDSLDIEESVIFEAIAANDLNVETSNVVLDLNIAETTNFGLDSGFTESTPDLSLDFSDNWLDEITDDEDEVIGKSLDLDDDISIGYPSETPDMSGEDSYEFADNLLDSLMDESDEEFADLSMDLSNLPTVSDLVPNAAVETVEAEDNDDVLENEFDFSIFDLPIEDSISSAMSEIDDFLSGSLDIGDVADDSSLKQDENKSNKSISETGKKLVDPDNSV